MTVPVTFEMINRVTLQRSGLFGKGEHGHRHMDTNGPERKGQEATNRHARKIKLSTLGKAPSLPIHYNSFLGSLHFIPWYLGREGQQARARTQTQGWWDPGWRRLWRGRLVFNKESMYIINDSNNNINNNFIDNTQSKSCNWDFESGASWLVLWPVKSKTKLLVSSI